MYLDLSVARTPHNQQSETELAQPDMPYEASVYTITHYIILYYILSTKHINLITKNRREKKKDEKNKTNINLHLLMKIIRKHQMMSHT